MERSFHSRASAAACGGSRPGLHIALAVEMGTLVDDEFPRSQVADQRGFGLQNDLLGDRDIARDLATDLRATRLDVAFDDTLRCDGDGARGADHALERAFDAEVVLHEHLALDDRPGVDEGESLAARCSFG